MSAQPTLDKWEHLDVESVFQRAGVDLTAAQLVEELDPVKINCEGARAFVARHGVQTDFNCNALDEWCKSRDIPMTVKNLEIAMADIKDRGLWDHSQPVVAEAEHTEPKVLVRRRQATAAESVPAAHDEASLRKMPLSELAKLIKAEKQGNAPAQDVVIIEEGTKGVEPDFVNTDDQITEPVRVETEADLKKLPLDQLRKKAYAERFANRTSPVTAIR